MTRIYSSSARLLLAWAVGPLTHALVWRTVEGNKECKNSVPGTSTYCRRTPSNPQGKHEEMGSHGIEIEIESLICVFSSYYCVNGAAQR